MVKTTLLLVQVAMFLTSAFALGEERLPSTEEINNILSQTTVKTLYVVSSSHWDLGFIDPTDVVQDRVKVHLDEVIENCLHEPRLRWTVESVWQVLEWLKRTSDTADRKRFFDLVREGRIGIGATFGGMHTGRMGTEEVCRFLYAGQRLAQEYNLTIDTAMMDDVPGYSWALPQVFSRAGVKYFLTGVNTRFGGRLAIPLKDMPFWWVGRDGSRVLTWICDGYGEAARTYHLPPTAARFFADAFKKPWLKKIKDLNRIQELGMAMALKRLQEAGYNREYLVTISSMDFISSDRAVELRRWIDQWNRTHSKPKIVQATPSQFFAAAVERDGDNFPTYSGDFAGLWETGHATAPVFRANVNTMRELLGPLETVVTLSSLLVGEPYPRLRLHQCWESLLQCHEHGFGIGVGWPKLMTRDGVLHNNLSSFRLAASAADQIKFLLGRRVSALCNRARINVPIVLVFNPLSWARTAPVSVRVNAELIKKPFALVDEAAGDEVPYDVLQGESVIRFIARNLPSVGYKRYRIEIGREPVKPLNEPHAEAGHLENAAFKVTVDEEAGRVTSIRKRRSGRELLSRKQPEFGRLLRRGHTADFHGADIYHSADDAHAEVTYENGATAASVTIEHSNSPLARLKLTLYRDLDWLLVEMLVDRERTRHVPITEHSDHYYASFLFGISALDASYRFDGPAGLLNAEEDFLPGAMRGRFVAQHVVEITDTNGYRIALSPREACICYIGRATDRTAKFAPKQVHLLWKVVSDADEGQAKDLGVVRYPFIEPGSQKVTFHFVLRAGHNQPGGINSYRFGVEQAVQPVAYFLPVAVKPLFRPLSPRLPATRSFIEISPPNVVLLTLKLPEDRADNDLILRFMEMEGRAADVQVKTFFPLKSAALCNLVERPIRGQGYPVSPLRFHIAAHEIITIRARRVGDPHFHR